MPTPMQFAICNETFGDWPWPHVCEAVARFGYDGIEIAPFTFAPSVEEITEQQRREMRQVAADNNLEIVGLHWLLAAPPGLHIHTKDNAVRQRTVDYLRYLIDFAGDLGARVMVFGSPSQRRLEDGDYAGAWQRTQDSYRQVLPALSERDVILCQESLPGPESDFIINAAEGARMVEEIGHPNFRFMLDVKSMCSEAQSPAAIIRQYCPLVAHFHANDANRRGPGFGDTDFRPIAAALRECEYSGYVSVEVFDYTPDPETIARESLRHLREVFEQ
ncbi:MAG TPA: sugar phosphate isomerase/epimerase family protein [Abditibacteriaceae bacterium]|nr:sugar phosphate isomerase/epimerase family protein [Abditibacteriaceae bacterium]